MNWFSKFKVADRVTLPTHRQVNPKLKMPIMPEDRQPLKNDDVIRVFHGFRDLSDAVAAVQHGISGQDRVGRTYSFENNNNPTGLFVTTDLKTAKEFVGGYGMGAIIEFFARVSDLESPVWPGGAYTVQGQMAEYFTDDSQREEARGLARERANSQGIPSISDSDKPELSESMFSGAEPQALFTGHLNPNMIKAVWVDRPGEKGYRVVNSQYERLTPKEFLKEVQDMDLSPSSGRPKLQYRMFRPNDEWDEGAFFAAMDQRFGGSQEEMTSALQHYARGGDTELLRYVWPKQLAGLKQYLQMHEAQVA